ncbi:MAG: phosphoribosylaminoimidazolesuccinocarboxamide synthase, partial [Cytophagales bacterium]|nr:phosphoribosylaminoimidazolesuccinocarboxamide synthase [Cytophagales bacterium]
MSAIKETNFKFPNQTGFYRGKVRDVYEFNDKLVMVVTDRISAFDVILPRAIPFKGQVLNQLAAKFLEATSDIVPNWVTDVPDPSVSIGLRCAPYPIEMVIRGYLAGHAWREYRSDKRILCGETLPDGLKENDKLPEPIITPTTKASEGHDEDISKDEILKNGLITPEDYEKLEQYTKALFRRGTEIARKRGLILVDTKYEFGTSPPAPLHYRGEGRKNGEVATKNYKIYLIDEIHTPDSSRYFYIDGYEERQKKGEPQKQLSKEFVRQWLIENNFQGKPGQVIP